MRSFSDINVLAALVIVFTVCALVNLNTTLVVAEWAYEGVVSLVRLATVFVGGIA